MASRKCVDNLCEIFNLILVNFMLIYNAPTAGRLIAELIEEVVMLGGGYGPWAGCAAGDTGAAMVFKIG